LDLSDITELRWEYQVSETKYFYLYLDWIRMDDIDMREIKKFKLELKPDFNGTFYILLDYLKLNEKPELTDGYRSKALKIDGFNYARATTTSPDLDGNDCTIWIWFKREKIKAFRMIRYKWNPILGLEPNNSRLRYSAYDGAGKTVYLSIPDDGEWYLAIQRIKQESTSGKYDGQNKAWLFNTSDLLSTTERNDLGTTQRSNGQYYTFPRRDWMGWLNAGLKGYIGETGIALRALTDEEINLLWKYYGYATPNYPNCLLMKKKVYPEPKQIGVSDEVVI